MENITQKANTGYCCFPRGSSVIFEFAFVTQYKENHETARLFNCLNLCKNKSTPLCFFSDRNNLKLISYHEIG